MHLPFVLCCGAQICCLPTICSESILGIIILCVRVPFSKLHKHAYLYCFSGTKDCLQTNNGMCCAFYCSCITFHVSMFVSEYLNMHFPFFFDVVYTQLHCLPTNYNNNVVTTFVTLLSMLLL